MLFGKKKLSKYDMMREAADKKAEEIADRLVQDVINKKDDLDVSTAIYACALSMQKLASLYYKNKNEEYMDAFCQTQLVGMQLERELGKPMPCGKCRSCKAGKTCDNPQRDLTLLTISKQALLLDLLSWQPMPLA